MKYKAILFDMDGTILDTLMDLGDAVNVALEAYGFSPCTYEQSRDYIGDGVVVLMRRAIAKKHLATDELPDCPSEILEGVIAKFNEYYAAHNTDKTRPFPGMTELIKKVRALGYKTAVISNKNEEYVKYLADLYFPDCFDIIAGNLPGSKTKPDPELPLRVISMLGLQPSDCLYIGDTEIDIRTCENAGCNAVLVDWGNRDKDFLLSQGAPAVVSDVEELYSWVNEN